MPFGAHLLRNDVQSALGIAAATGGEFVRVNVHTGARLTIRASSKDGARDGTPP
ncbi:BtpA/SgcQ family protein [Halobellus salinisoli]|uniref:BtpA/SgcQ family protein n=1 Tax=Halobellus salinisoli TaxID=3108500 RepID=UPI0031F2DBCB